MKKNILLILAAVLFACAATPALARHTAGGRNIATAPMVTSGATNSQNSASDPTGPGQEAIGQGCFLDAEWWKLPLTAGDKVEITGEEKVAGRGIIVAVFSPSTSDKNAADAESVAHGFPAEHKLTFKADVSGAYPLAAGPNCYNGTDGQFDFTVSITHGSAPVALSITKVANGTVSVKAAGASGVLKLYGSWGGKPHLLATAKPANGTAQFKYHLPGGVHGTVDLTVSGSGATSAAKHVKA